MSEPLLSVIVTTYNREKYIEDCIKSIQKQTYRNIEILIIDDCSQDNTEDLIKNMQNEDKRVRYIKHPKNRGAGAAKNTGIDEALGKYTTYLDSDDRIANVYAYETAINILESKNVDVYSYKHTYNNSGRKISRKHKIYKINSDNILNPSTMLPLKVFKSEQLKKIRNKEYILYDDVSFWIDFCLTNVPVIYQTENEFYYINNEDHVSITSNQKNNIKIFETFKEIENIIREKGSNIENSNAILYMIINTFIFFMYEKINDNVLKNKYKTLASQYLLSIDNTLGIIGNEIDLRSLVFFINDEIAEKKYLKDIDVYRINKYKYIKPNILMFKLEREIKRILKQLKNLISHQ